MDRGRHRECAPRTRKDPARAGCPRKKGNGGLASRTRRRSDVLRWRDLEDRERDRDSFAAQETRRRAGRRGGERNRKPRCEPSKQRFVQLARARSEIDTVKASEPHTLVRAARCVRTAVLRRLVTSETSYPEANERSASRKRSAARDPGSRAGWELARDSHTVTKASEVGTSKDAGWDRLTGPA